MGSRNSSIPEISWNVWNRSSTVIWDYNGIHVHLEYKLPPLSVSLLTESRLVAISVNYEEAGSDNLYIYDFDGRLTKRFRAPDLGAKSQFGSVKEMKLGRYEASIGYFKNGEWEDVVCEISIDSGELMGATRRGY